MNTKTWIILTVIAIVTGLITGYYMFDDFWDNIKVNE